MTGSRVRRLAFSLALLAPVAGAPTAAQWSSDKPPVLTPEDYPPEPADVPAPGAQQSSASADTASGAPRVLQNNDVVTALPPPAKNIEVGTLGMAEGPPAGTLDPLTGGLDGNIWSGSERARVLDLLKRAPLAYADPAFRNAVKKIVLTRAVAPSGPASRAFVTLRIEKLLDAGLIEEAGAIAAQAAVPNDDDFTRVQARALLISGRSGDVCSDKTAARLNSADVFWMQLRAYCAVIGGDQPAAELTMAVLRAKGENDAAFDRLLEDVMNREGVSPGPIAHPTAMHVFLFRQASMPVPYNVARTMGTAENLLVMRDARNPAADRFEAAERIIATGAASVNELKVLANAQELPLPRVANAATEAPGLPFFAGQTLLRRAAVIEQRAEGRALLASQALTLGHNLGLLPLASAFQADVIVSLRPSAATPKPLARSFTRALLLAGQPDMAALWAKNDPVMLTVTAIASNDPARLAAVQKNLDVFAASLMKDPPDPDPDGPYKALVVGLADVLGLPMPKDARAQAAAIASHSWPGKHPASGVMRAIEGASLRLDQRGEALLMIIDTMRETGLENLAPDVTIEFVRLLVGMNEPQMARAFALDALAQYVPPPPPAPPAPAQ